MDSGVGIYLVLDCGKTRAPSRTFQVLRDSLLSTRRHHHGQLVQSNNCLGPLSCPQAADLPEPMLLCAEVMVTSGCTLWVVGQRGWCVYLTFQGSRHIARLSRSGSIFSFLEN